jgi:hypothetical protein
MPHTAAIPATGVNSLVPWVRATFPAMRLSISTLIVTALGAVIAFADPYGPPYAVTDMAPFCASCHASTSLGQLPELTRELAVSETIEEKHFKQIQTGAAYKDLTAAEREQLLAAVRWVDQQATVLIDAPRSSKRNARIEVTIITKGGAGPVVGLSLVDSGIRYQARPITSSGFKVLGPPFVIGPDGKAQAEWVDRRVKGSDLGLSTIMIFGVHGDAATKRVDESRTTWTLRTPSQPGIYRLAAAFYYGTEKAHPLGVLTRNGRIEPRGGHNGGSGRIMFSDIVPINVY